MALGLSPSCLSLVNHGHCFVYKGPKFRDESPKNSGLRKKDNPPRKLATTLKLLPLSYGFIEWPHYEENTE
jgi:hypothetical protein